MSTQITVDAQIRRAEIEAHMRHCRNAVLLNLVEIGRWLNTAKQEGVVPHGQWTAWAQEHSGLSERDMQRAMQMARELPEGSPLERLGVTKISALLTLPAEEREAVAQQIDAEHATSREVKARIDAIKAERDEALRVMGEQKKRLREMAQEKDALITDAIARTRVDVTKEKEEEIERVRELARDSERKMLAETEAARAEAESLRVALDVERRSARIPDPKQERRIRELQEQVEKKEQEIDRLSDALDEAQTAAMRGGMAGSSEKPSPATMILSSIGALMAQAGRAPAELARLQGMDTETREILCGQARLVGQWAMQILAACGEGDADV